MPRPRTANRCNEPAPEAVTKPQPAPVRCERAIGHKGAHGKGPKTWPPRGAESPPGRRA
jgi:hypothetical protein